MFNVSSLDTNLIARFLIGDVPAQQKKVIRLLSDSSHTFVVEDAAIIELVHVLETIYHFTRAEISMYIKKFCSMQNISTSAKIFTQSANLYLTHPKLSFNDCYLAVMSEHRSAEPLWTFDKKLATQLPSAKELKYSSKLDTPPRGVMLNS